MVLDSAVQNGSAVYDKWFSGSLTPDFKHKWYFKNFRHLDPVDLSFVYFDKKSVKVLPKVLSIRKAKEKNREKGKRRIGSKLSESGKKHRRVRSLNIVRI